MSSSARKRFGDHKGRIDITLDAALADEVKRLATKSNQSVSEWLVIAAGWLMRETDYEMRHYRPPGTETPAAEPAPPQ